MSNAAIGDRTEPAAPPGLVLNAGVLTINNVYEDPAAIRNLLLANPGVHGIVITQQTISGQAECDLLGQLDSIPTLGTIRIDLVGNRADGSRPCGMDLDVEARLAWLFAGNPNLTKLDLSGQGIRGGFLFDLAKSLDTSTTSRTFNFDAGDFHPTVGEDVFYGEIASGIACLIAKPDCAATIRASSRRITDDGAMQIAAALAKNTSLTTLVLADNWISDKGHAAIFDAIRKNKVTALSHLDLSGSRIGIKAAKSLAALLKKNTSLVEVAIGTTVDAESLKHIRDGLLKNVNVVKLATGRIDNPDKKLLQIRSEIDKELQKHARTAAGRHVSASSTANTAGCATTTAHAKAISGKEPG
jgi:hypothetical protein